MNKHDHLARFLTCLLPCSLIMTSLPIRANDPAGQTPNTVSALPDSAGSPAAPESEQPSQITSAGGQTSETDSTASAPANLPAAAAPDSSQAQTPVLENDPNSPAAAIPLADATADLASLIQQVSVPVAGAPFVRSVNVTDGVAGVSSVNWTDAEGNSVIGSKAGFNTVYCASITITLQEGYTPSGAPLNDNWLLQNGADENTIVLSKTFPITRKEHLTVDPLPEDVTLLQTYNSFKAVMNSTYAPNPVGMGTRESGGEKKRIYYTYECPDYNPARGAVNTVHWTAEFASFEGLNLADFDSNVALSGTITITNAPVLDPNLGAVNSWRDYTVIPIDITSSFTNPYRLPVTYWWIKSDGTEEQLYRGLFNAPGIGSFTIEMRSDATDDYKASAVRRTITISPKDVSSLISPEREDWVFMSDAAPLTVDVQYDQNIPYLSQDDFTLGTVTKMSTGETFDPSDTLEPGDYEAQVVLKEGITNYKLNTPVSVHFTVTKAPRTWSDHCAKHIELNQRYPIDLTCNGNGDYTYQSSAPGIIHIESDENGTYMVGQSYGQARITVSVSETDLYLSDSWSVDVKAGYQTPQWANLPDSLEYTYGDEGQLLAPICTSDGEKSWRVKPGSGDAVSIDERGYVTIKKAGTAVLEFTSTKTEEFEASCIEVPVTVHKKAITVKADQQEMIYGDAIPELTWSADGLVHGDTLEGITLSAPQNPDAGIHAISVQVDDNANPNYAITAAEGKLLVGQKTLHIVWLEDELIYNGQEQFPRYQIIGAVEGDEDLDCYGYGEQTKAGTGYKAQLTSPTSPNYNLDASTTTHIYSILKKDAVIRLRNLSKTYGEQDENLKSAVRFEDELARKELIDKITVIREPGENAGSYKLSVQVPDEQSNFNVQIANEGYLTIDPRIAAIAWSYTQLTYNGKPQTPSARVCDGLVGSDTCDVILEGAQVHAGENYTVTITGLSNPNYTLHEYEVTSVPFSIRPKDAVITADDLRKTYGTADPQLTFTAEGLIEGDTAGQIGLKRAEGENVGDYTIIPTVTDQTNPDYRFTMKPGTLTIEKRSVTVRVKDQTITYGDPILAFEYKADNLVSGETLAGISTSWDEDTNAGTHTITLTHNSDLDSNYEVTCENGTLTILPKTVGITWSDTDLVYNGTRQHPVAHLDGILSGDTCTFTQSGEQIHAGTYSAKIDSLSNSNYALPADGSAQTRFTISPKAAMVTANPASKTYGEPDPKLAYTVSGILEEDTAPEILIRREEGENAGEYAITLLIDKESCPDYRFEHVNSTFTISQRPVTLNWDETPLVYNGTPQHPALHIEGILDSDTCNAEIAGAETNAGTYQARIESLSNSNYVLSKDDETAEFTISPKNVTLNWKGTDLVYTGKEQKPEAVLEGILDGDECTANVDGGAVHAGEGYTAFVTSLSNSNYAFDEKQASTLFSIRPAVLTLNIKDAEKTFGDPDPKFEAALEGWLDEEENRPEVILIREEGEDAGEYEIKGDITALTGDYTLETKNGTMTIQPRSIDDLSATLKDLLRENGTALEQTLEDLTWTAEDGSEYPVPLECSGHIQSAGGAYVMTIRGTENFTGELKQSFVVLPASGPTFPRADEKTAQIGKGTLVLDVVVDETLPKAEISTTHEDLLNQIADSGVLSAMDLAAIADGHTETLTLHLQDRSSDLGDLYPITTPPETEVHARLFSLALEHPFGNASARQNPGTGTSSYAMLVTMALPEEMRKEGTELKLLSVGNGESTPIAFTKSADGTSITFSIEPGMVCHLISQAELQENIDKPEEPNKPDKSDKPDSSNSSNSSSNTSLKNEGSSDSSTSSSSNSKSANTAIGQAADLMVSLIAMIGGAGGTVLTFLGLRKKKQKEEEQ